MTTHAERQRDAQMRGMPDEKLAEGLAMLAGSISMTDTSVFIAVGLIREAARRLGGEKQ